MTLDDLRWDRRILVATGNDATAHEALVARLAERRRALAERDVAVYRLSGLALEPLHAAAPALEPLDEAARRVLIGLHDPAAAVDTAFDGTEPFEPVAFLLILIGKDGTAKRRVDSPDALDSLLELIDTMPMRQQEMDKQDD